MATILWEAIHDSAKIWKELAAVIAGIISEGNFIATNEKLELLAMDDSRVSLVYLDFPSDAFARWAYNAEEERLKIGVNFADFKRVMARGKAKDSIKFLLKREGEKAYFTVAFFRGTEAAQRAFNLPILDIPEERIPLKELAYKVRVVFSPPTFFADMMRDAKVVGEELEIVADKDQELLIFRAVSETGGTYEYSVNLRESGDVVEFNIEETSSARYSVDFLTKFARAAKIAESLTIQYSKQMPLQLDFSLPGGARLTFLLAPRL